MSFAFSFSQLGKGVYAWFGMTRHRIVALTICLGLAVGLFFFLGPFGEPSYQGRSLTEWLDGVVTPPGASGRPMATQQALQAAVKHMGPRGAVFLGKCVEGEPVLGFRRMARIRSALPLSLRSSRFMFWLERRAAESETSSQIRASVAVGALISLREDARPAVPLLVRAFRRPGSAFDNYRAAEVLAGLGRVALPEVLKGLADPRFSNHQALALVIGRMHGLGETAAPAVPLLCNGLSQGAPGLSQACAGALGNLALMPELAVPALAGALSNALRTTDVGLCRNCAEALEKFGPLASNAVPVLCAALNAPDGIATEAAARALGKCGAGSEVAVPALIDYLRDSGWRHRKYAIEGLAGYGAAASNAIPLVRDALKDDDHDTRAAARAALQAIIPD
jgi:HEAT repeat protein